VAVQVGPHDAQDGDDEQDGAGHVGADEDGGEEAWATRGSARAQRTIYRPTRRVAPVSAHPVGDTPGRGAKGQRW